MTRAGTIMNALAALILVSTAIWGATIYPHLPETVPTHWNAAGEADAFSRKSVWSVFGPLMIGGVMALGLFATRWFVSRGRDLVPAERRAYDLCIGYANMSLAALFAWISVMAWFDREPGPLFIVMSLLGSVPVLLIIGLHLPAITRERKAVTGADEPSLNPDHWVWGGIFYSNPNDPRVFVPKPPHMGVGQTTNLATRGGKLLMGGILLLVVVTLALPFLV